MYSGNISVRNVSPGESNATAKWVGFSFRSTSSTAFVKPKIADVFRPWELIRGFLMKA